MRRYVAILRSSDITRYEIGVPDFPDCAAVEDSLERAVRSAARTVRRRIAGMQQRGEPVPEPRTAQQIRSDRSWEAALAQGILTILLVPIDAVERSDLQPVALAG